MHRLHLWLAQAELCDADGSAVLWCTCAPIAPICVVQFFTRPFVDGDSVLVQAAGGLVVSGVVERTTSECHPAAPS
jgi:hypothetical protein